MVDETQTDAAPDFRELMRNTTSDNVERRKALPKGHYIGMILSHSFDQSRVKKTWFVRFALKIDGPGPDIPPGTCDGIDWSRQEGRLDRYITPKAMSMLTDTLDAVLGRDSRPVDERVPEMDNQPILIELEVQTDDKGNELPFNDVVSIVKYNPNNTTMANVA